MRKIVVLAVLVLAAGSWWRVMGPQPPPAGPSLRKVMPAVVSITAQAREPAEDNPLYKDPFFRRYCGEQAPAESQVQA